MQAKKQHDLVGLDILKALAIISVILNHLLPNSGFGISFLYAYGIYMAVPVFMVISGYLFSYVSDIKETGTLLSYFRPGVFGKRLFAYAFPFFIVLLCECLFLQKFSIRFFLSLILTGGVHSPGNYYVPVFFQFLIIFPFLYQLSKIPQFGTFVVLILWIVFEHEILQIREGVLYRFLFFRYLLFVWGGILLYKCPWFIRTVPKLAVLSLLYITLLFNHYKPAWFYGWAATSGLTAGWDLFLVAVFMKMFQKMPPLPLICNIGRQTWHIYLFQMFYLRFIGHLPLFAQFSRSEHFFCCLIGGVLFYCFCRFLLYVFRKIYAFLKQKTQLKF